MALRLPGIVRHYAKDTRHSDSVRHAMTRLNNKDLAESNGAIAVDANRLAELLELSVRTIRRLDSAGKLPRPVRIGGAVRWSVSEITHWLDAGCPDRQRWEALRRQEPKTA